MSRDNFAEYSYHPDALSVSASDSLVALIPLFDYQPHFHFGVPFGICVKELCPCFLHFCVFTILEHAISDLVHRYLSVHV